MNNPHHFLRICLLLLTSASACGTSPSGASLRSSAPRAVEIATAVSYPEGSLFHGDTLYFVEYGGNAVQSWKSGVKRQIWKQEGCGPAAVLFTSETDLWVTCYDSNSLVEIDLNGRLLQTLTQDDGGAPFLGPNDFASDGQGGFYFSTSGVWDTAAPVAGRVYHRSASGSVQSVADKIHYSNGLAFTDGGHRLLVAETLENDVLAFDVGSGGALEGRTVWAKLDELIPNPSYADGYLGPDGLKANPAGDVVLAQNGASRVLVLDAGGKLLESIDLPARYVTNVAFGPTGNELFATATVDDKNAPYLGSVFQIDNVSFSR